MNDKQNHIYRAFENAWKRCKEKKWDKIYILVDVHGVMMEPDYQKPSTFIYSECVEPLRAMSTDPRFILIMWTCSRKEDIQKYLIMFKGLSINFDYVNENPEVQNINSLGDYTAKLYANVILDDKAGFEPSDWNYVNSFLQTIDVKL